MNDLNSIVSRMARSRATVLCLVFLGIVALLGIIVPWLPLPNPVEVSLADKFAEPGPQHWLGCDQLGRDILSRLLWGIRPTLFVALLAMCITSSIGAFYGSVAGLARGRVDSVLMRICDIMMSFPSEVMILAIVGILGPGLENVLLACVVAKWPWYARMTRSSVLAVSNSGYVRYARVAGKSSLSILRQHVLPVVIGDFFVLMTIDSGSIILMLSALSFLGLGIQPPTPEWGSMLAQTKDVLSLYPWQMLPPGVAILSVVAALNFLGDGLRELFDVRASREER